MERIIVIEKKNHKTDNYEYAVRIPIDNYLDLDEYIKIANRMRPDKIVIDCKSFRKEEAK